MERASHGIDMYRLACVCVGGGGGGEPGMTLQVRKPGGDSHLVVSKRVLESELSRKQSTLHL